MELNKIYQGNNLDVLRTFPDNFIDCVVTSPPYYGLRDYGEATKGIWGGDVNCEHDFETHEHWIHTGSTKSKLIRADQSAQITNKKTTHDTCMKCGAWKGQLGLESTFHKYLDHLIEIFAEVKRILKPNKIHSTIKRKSNIQSKSLLNIPSRFAIKMTDELGFIQRNEIIWLKRNCMPASVRDRFTVDFEKVYFFTKSKRYYFEQQTEPSVDPESYTGRKPRNKGTMYGIDRKNYAFSGNIGENGKLKNEGKTYPNRNKRCVWEVNTKPYKEAHFAVFPDTLIEPMIKAGCPADGIVLDMFFGSGTTGIVALKQNKNFIGIELNEKYINMANKRLSPYLEQERLAI